MWSTQIEDLNTHASFALTIWAIQYIDPFKDLVLKVKISPESVGKWMINVTQTKQVVHTIDAILLVRVEEVGTEECRNK